MPEPWKKKYTWRRDRDAVSDLFYARDGDRLIGGILHHDKGWWQYWYYGLNGHAVKNWREDTAAEAAKAVEDGWDALKAGE